MVHIFGYEITLLQIFATIFGIGILVFVHELGHFLMAKAFKLRVEKFTFGFGPELIGFSYKETRYSICAIPLGGMVKMPGEDIDNATGSPDEFLSQSWYKRMAIAFFGPLMNYLLAIVIFVFVILTWGVGKPSDQAIIGELIDGYPAQKAGLAKDDRILKINGLSLNSWVDMAEFIHKHPEEKLSFIIDRGGKQLNVNIEAVKDTASGVGVIGIMPKVLIEKVGFIESVEMSAKMVVYQSYYTLKYLGEKIVRWEKPELAGPIGVVHILARAAKTGPETLLHLFAVISVALGLFNLLPIPLVDGGHIFLALIEAVTRRQLNKKIIQTANFVGFGIIISIFIFATYSDLARLGLNLGKFLPR